MEAEIQRSPNTKVLFPVVKCIKEEMCTEIQQKTPLLISFMIENPTNRALSKVNSACFLVGEEQIWSNEEQANPP